MPQYLAPGVYVEEIDTGSKPIEGVSTSIVGVVGVTERGPVNVPILVTSSGEFAWWFGGRLDADNFGAHRFLPHAAEGFFTNGGQQLYVTRVLDTGLAAAASAVLFDRNAPNTPFDSMLLRAASEATGTAANPPPLLILPSPTGALKTGDFVRIGEGSNAEYPKVAAAPVAEDVLVPLHLPLGHSHDAGTVALQFDRTPINGALTLTADAAAGALAIDVEGASGDIAALSGIGSLLEIGAQDAEYRFVTAVGGVTFSGPSTQRARLTLDAPLTLAHAQATTARQLIGGPSAAAGGGIQLTVDANQNDSVLKVDGVIADVDALPGSLVHISDGATDEYRTVVSIGNVVNPTSPGHESADVTLSSPLTGLKYKKATAVVQRMAAAPGATKANVTPAARSGDCLLYVDTRGGAFTNRSKLVLLDSGSAQAEVRRIGQLFAIDIASVAEADYPNGSVARIVTLGDDGRVALGGPAAIGAGSIPVKDARPFHVGQQILIGTAGGPYEIQKVKSIAIGAAPAGTLNLDGTLAAAKVATDLAIGRRQLVKASAAGVNFISVDDRSGLALGDVLHLVDGSSEEFVQVAGLPLPAAPGVWPDGGNIVLSAPLLSAFSTATLVIRQNVPSDSGLQPSALALDAASGSTQLMIADGNGWVVNGIIQVQTAQKAYFHRIRATPAAPVAPLLLTLDTSTALERSHPLGSPLSLRQPLFDVAALDPGAWGDRLRIAIEDEESGLVSSARFLSVVNATRARVASVAGMEPGTVLELVQKDGSALGDPVKIAAVNRAGGEITFDAAHALSPAQMGAAPNITLRSREFRLSVFLYEAPDPSAPTRAEPALPVEVFRNLSMDPRHSRYFQAAIGDRDGLPLRLSDHRPEGSSWFIRVHDTGAAPLDVRLGPETLVDVLPDGRKRPARRALEGGDDALLTLTDADYIGADAADPEQRTGLYTLLNVNEISIIGAPGRTSAAMQQALIDQCENNRYRFAVLDGPPPPADSLVDVQNQRQQFDTKYAALYHPWLLIPNPFPGTPGAASDYPIPPSGHMLGVYARIDISRGVHKAPANEVVNGIIGLQRIVNKEQQDILNPYPVNINVIRDFRNQSRGIRVYGGRVITSDSDWKYVNVRRLLIYIEASLNQGLQWVVFEPNAEDLWARVRRSISNFLTLVWRNGALEGTKPAEAFFVKCDRTTMTQTDIDEGRLICLVGVAPVKPAEFVIVRIGLMTASSDS